MGIINPDDMIRANGAAEAAQTDRLKAQIGTYGRQLEELRELYEKNNALVEKLQAMSAATTDQMRSALQESASKLEAGAGAFEQLQGEDFHKRLEESIDLSREKIAELLQQSDEFAHKENVRVYRNIQASMIAELDKQTKTLQETLHETDARLARMEEALEEPVKPRLRWIQIVILVAALAALCFEVLEFLGLNLAAILRMAGL